jgi:hypothetical protein
MTELDEIDKAQIELDLADRRVEDARDAYLEVLAEARAAHSRAKVEQERARQALAVAIARQANYKGEARR